MKVLRAYKTEIDPNNVQRTLLLKHAGTARYAYNWGLIEKKKAFKTKHKIPNAIELHRRLNALKPTDFPWMYEVSKCSPQEALRNLDRAFDNFFRRCKAKKQGKHKGKTGFPRFKSKKKSIGSFRLTGTIKVYRNSIQLPRLGILSLKETDYIPQDAKIMSATISEHAGRWFVSIQVEETIADPKAKPESIVGIDLGIKTLATCSDGTVFENPKTLRKNMKKIKRLSRSLHRKQKVSKNRKKAARRLAKLHYRIGNIRKDTIHKITTQLAKTKSVIGIEDLNVSGMMKNHCIAQAISDLGLYEFRRQLKYKGELYGCKIVLVDRFFPSSKMCSICGCLNNNLELSDRFWTCDCGAKHDRDMNAAMNIKDYTEKALTLARVKEQAVASSAKALNAYGEDLPLVSSQEETK